MDYPFPLAGQSPEFEDDDIDWALAELLRMIWKAKWAGCLAQDYNPLLFYRCMHVIGCQPLLVRLKCLDIVRSVNPGWIRGLVTRK